MKKYIALFLLLTGGLNLTSCSDTLLDPYTPGALDGDTVITSPQELERLMNSVYSIITSANEISVNTQLSDETAIGYANGGQGEGDELQFIVNSNSASANGIWTTHYIALAYLNRIIDFSEVLEPTAAADIELLKRLRAEALTLRAYSHNVLTTYYSTNPKDPSALGVILADRVYPVNTIGSRATNAEIYALIDADIQEALDLYAGIPASNSTNPILANRNFTMALKARTLALRGDYPGALTAADAVITGSGLSLATFSNGANGYQAVFNDANSATTEIIFKLKQLNGGIELGGLWATNVGVLGAPWWEMGRGLFNDLNTTDEPTVTPVTITAIAPFSAANGGSKLTIPGHTLQIGDMVTPAQSYPAGVQMGTNGIATTPTTNAMPAGKVYFVKSISGDDVYLTDTAYGTANINFTNAIPGLPLVLNTAPGDIRYAVNVHPSSVIRADYQTVTDYKASDKLIHAKYKGTAATGAQVNDVKIARLSEMYFIKAEALTAAGDLVGAATQIQIIRNARFNRPQPMPVYGSAVDAWKDILLERKKELAAEGFRYVDIKRLGALAGEGIQRYERDCALIGGACSLPVTDYRFTLPIPAVERDPNPGIQQNPGYE